MKVNKPELLAPVGGRQQLVAAVNNGADAVYMGGPLFNARMKAENFSREDLAEAVDYAHERNVRVYITINTLIKDSELVRAFEYVNYLYSIGVDAVIIQDMGLARLIRRHLPDMKMHLSTQGTVYNTQALDMVREFGFSRVVPARELSMKEIEELTAAAQKQSIEVEVFVHGALCMCYSGQCQMSRLMGRSARSGNRGLCAQPCRLLYEDSDGRQGYLLSPKDICTLSDIPDLCRAGVHSFKIEGRLKSAEYVAVVTGIYRKYIDRYFDALAEGTACRPDFALSVDTEDMRNLLQIFNRGGFTEGYLGGNPGQKILSGFTPKNQGICVGRVLSVMKASGKAGAEGRQLVDVEIYDGNESIALGDGVEIGETGNVVTFIEPVSGCGSKGGSGKTVLRIGDFRGAEKMAGKQVYRVTDKALLNAAAESFAGGMGSESDGHFSRLVPLKMTFTAGPGKKAGLTVTEAGDANGAASENAVTVCSDSPIEKAVKRPSDPARISEQLARLGGTPYRADTCDITVEVEADSMAPVSVINGLRREAVELLLEKKRIRREGLPAECIAEVRDEIEGAAEGGMSDTKEDSRQMRLVPLELFMKGTEGTPYILNVSKGNLDRYIEKNFDEIVSRTKKTGIAVGNLGWISQFRKAGVKVYGDYGLNVFNRQADIAFAEAGVDVIVWSDEMSGNGKHCCNDGAGNVPAAPERIPKEMEKIPLIITEHPLESEYLVDRKGVSHSILKWYSEDKYLLF